jgi:hypothetical protein
MPASKSKAKAKPGGDPFVGRDIILKFAADGPPFGPVSCLARDGNLLHVRYGEVETWVNLDHVASVTIAAPSPAADPSAVDPAQVSDALAAHKANPGPLKDTGP